MSNKKLRLIIFGRQGAGKGTQCALLIERYGSVHISTGDILRAAVAEGTEFGRRADDYMSAGNLVPDEVMIGIVKDRLAKADVVNQGFLLDGFPRTEAQARALIDTLGEAGIDLAIDIDVPLEVVKERMAGRNRADDTTEAIERRLAEYEAKTMPAVRWFTTIDKLVSIDGVGAETAVFDRLTEVIDAHT
ncbi:MAG: adenylate kinase [Acidimicrobiales bacterium]